MIHHTKKFRNLGFEGGVLDVCVSFLKEHPTEFVYMQIKEEFNPSDNTESFFESMQKYIEGSTIDTFSEY